MKIQWTSPAVSDLESIREYISKDSIFYANRFIDKIFDSVEILAGQPEIGRIIPEIERPNLRELLFQNFRIMYRIQADVIQIIAIIRASRDISRLTFKPWEII
jgi:plasmid stabilization system protein ParE